MSADGRGERRRRREQGSGGRTAKRVLAVVIVLVVLLGGLAGAGAYLWGQYGAAISLALGWTSNDYEGEGHGEALVTITEGEIGADVADSLADAGVVKTSEAFYDLLLAQEPAVEFGVGTYRLKLEMSAQAALDALQDPENEMALTVTIPEGASAERALELVAGVTEVPLEELQDAVAKPADLGVPEEFPTIEGFLFPATYTFEPGDTAETIAQTMVDRMWQALDEHGVDEDDAFEVLTLASMVQREAGSDPDDFPKVARVFLNRIDEGMLLQSDATVAYGTGNTDTVWTTDEERADKTNKYNTYAHEGLPIGPIGLPGDIAIDAAVHPAKGDWLYFVPINLETGETVFSKTYEEHEAAVAKLEQWCIKHAEEGGSYCD